MKKNISFYLVLITAPLIVILMLSNSSGAPTQGVTGSPGDGGNTCIICHSDADTNTAYNLSLNITTDIPSEGYVPGTTYHITLTPTATGAIEFGFQITAENTVAAKVGIFVVTDAINTQVDTNAHFVTQTFTGHENITSWSFNWIAPPDYGTPIKFYVAAIAGIENSGGGTSTIGNQMVLATYNVGSVLGINKAQLLNFSMFPNPSDGQVTLQLPSDANQAKVNVFDYLGKTLVQKSINASNNTLNVSNLSTGIYFVRIQSDSKVGTKKLIVR